MHYINAIPLPLPLSLWPRVDFGLNAICRLILFVLLSAPGASGGWAGVGVGNEKNEPQNEMEFFPWNNDCTVSSKYKV